MCPVNKQASEMRSGSPGSQAELEKHLLRCCPRPFEGTEKGTRRKANAQADAAEPDGADSRDCRSER
jgi:hypothetical protein